MQIISNFILKICIEKPLLMIMRVEKKVHKILKGFNSILELTEFLLFLYDRVTLIIDY